MRTLILIVAIVFLMALVGWVTFGVGPDRSSINLETDEIRQDTQQALESGAQVLRNAGKAVDQKDAEAETANRAAGTEEPKANSPAN
jgi:hypothetical protein